MSLSKPMSRIVSRRTQNFQAKKNSYSLSSPNAVQIEIDTSTEAIDFQNSRLFYKINFTATTGSTETKLLKFAGGNIVKNLRVKTLGGQLIGDDIRNYNGYQRMIQELKNNSDWNDSYGRVLENAEHSTAGYAADAVVSVTLSHQFCAHIMALKEYYPAHFTQGIIIEFDLPSTAAELFTVATGTLPAISTVSIEDPRMVCDLVKLAPEVEQAMISMVENNQLKVDYVSVLTQDNQIVAATNNANFDVVSISGRVKSAFTYMRLNANRDGITEANDYWARKDINNLTSYRYRLGSEYLNYQSIQTTDAELSPNTTEQVFELLKALDGNHSDAFRYQMGDSGLSGATFAADQLRVNNFVVGIKVDKEQSHTDESISSKMNKDRNNMRIELTFDGSNAAATAYTHITLDKSFYIAPGGAVLNN